MALSKEELEELAALEKEEKAAAEAQADAEARQRLDAKRMRKRLSKPGVEHGKDFVVVETNTGLVVALRRPTDLEVDAFTDSEDQRAGMEKFILSIAIEPTKAVLEEQFSRYALLAPALSGAVTGMLGKLREEEAKK